MIETEYEQLVHRVLAHEYRQQETYQIDGTRYVLEKGNDALKERTKGIGRQYSVSTERWALWMYPEGQSADLIAGDSIEEVFREAATKGVPVEKLTLDQWHD